MFACSSQSGKECKSCYTSFSSRWGCSGSTRQLWGTVHFNYPAETHAWDVSDCHASKATGILRAETNVTVPVQTGWAVVAWCTISCVVSHVHPFWSLSLLCIPLLWIQLDKQGWGMNCKSIPAASKGQHESAFAPGSDLGLLVAALERECSKQGISSTLFHRGMQSDPFSKLHIQWKCLPLWVSPCFYF